MAAQGRKFRRLSFVAYQDCIRPKVLRYMCDQRDGLLQQLHSTLPNTILLSPNLYSAPLIISHCIYAIFAFNPSNTTSKVYIGQTSKTIGERFAQHVRTMLRKRVHSHSDLIYTGRKMALHAAMDLSNL